DSTSNFNSVAEYHEKPLVDVETDNSFPEEVFYNKQELITEVAMVPANSVKRLNGKLLEEKDMDSFLLEAHKKIVSSEIKQCNKEKKLSKAEQASLNQDQESDTGCSTSEKIPEVSNPVTKISRSEERRVGKECRSRV